jgi:hypothetical protein
MRYNRLLRTAFAFLLCPGLALAQGITFAPGNYQNGSQVVGTSAVTVLSAPTGNNAKRSRIVALDTACQTGSGATIWCAWGTAAANPAVVGSNGFPLACGFDDNGPGVNQSALNCIQPTGTHYGRFEQY